MGLNGYVVGKNLIEYMLAHILRMRSVLSLAKEHLRPELFDNPSEIGYRHILQLAYDFYERHARLPDHNNLGALLMDEADASHAIPDFVGVDAANYLEWVGEQPMDKLDADVATDFMRAFLHDRLIGGAASQLHQQRMGSNKIDYVAAGSNISALARQIEGIGRKGHNVAIPAKWDRKDVPRTRTGVDFIDEYLGGGMEPHEVNCILGPTGVAKTLLGTQLAVSAGCEQYAAKLRGEPYGLTVMISYELPIAMIQIRMIANAAQVMKSRLEAMGEYTDLTTSATMLPYEIQQQSEKDPARRLGEQERIESVAGWMNEFVCPVDFSSSPTSEGGNGHINEVVYKLDQLQNDYGMPINKVILDWAGVAVDRYMEVDNNTEKTTKTQELGKYVRRVHDQITTQFGCTAWVMHQLRGQVSRTAPGIPLQHTDAEWCSGFAQSAWTALVLGTKDNVQNLCSLNASKTRQSAGKQSQIMYIDGEFSQLVPRSGLTLDPHTRSIVSRHEAAQIADYAEEGATLEAEMM